AGRTRGRKAAAETAETAEAVEAPVSEAVAETPPAEPEPAAAEPAPAPEPVAATAPEPELVMAEAPAPAEPDRHEISTPPATPRRGWWRRGG
ncbi:MAG TPA: hypothetical protein VG939_07640, partial [Caulobacteraceae bacterium]|nr:hypothetical protein [Caulobacteraceae bacterium]